MSATDQRDYVSRLVPRSETALTALIIGTCFIDSVVRRKIHRSIRLADYEIDDWIRQFPDG